MTSLYDPIELLVKHALDRSTEAGLVVLNRPEISLAEMPAGARFFKCVDSRVSLYVLKPAAYELAAARNWPVESRPCRTATKIAGETNVRDDPM
jgi:hypothetical protein